MEKNTVLREQNVRIFRVNTKKGGLRYQSPPQNTLLTQLRLLHRLTKTSDIIICVILTHCLFVIQVTKNFINDIDAHYTFNQRIK